MALTRVTAVWTGFSGAPGYTSLYFDGVDEITGPDGVLERVRVFFAQVASILPNSVSIQIQDETEVYDDATGQLISYMQASEALDPIQGSGGADYAGPSGAVITWNTSTISGSRRMRGRTFLVPLASDSYEGDGTLANVAVNYLRNAADALLADDAGAPFVIWSRPAGGGTGVVGPVTGYRVPDMAAVLRSRRD